jgi:hypothetical protein
VPIADPMLLREVLCVQEERIVARDNTVSFSRLKLPLPQSPLRQGARDRSGILTVAASQLGPGTTP